MSEKTVGIVVTPREAQAPAERRPDAPVVGPVVVARTSRRFPARDVVMLADLWVLVAVMWATTVIAGWLDPAVAAFEVAAFAFLTTTRTSVERLNVGALEDCAAIARSCLVAYAAASTLVVLTGIGDPALLLATAVASVAALVTGRGLAYRLTTSGRFHNPSRTLVIGAGDVARRVIEGIRAQPRCGLEVVGAVDDEPLLSSDRLGTPILGRLQDLPSLLASQDISTVVVAYSAVSESRVAGVARAASEADARVWIVPRFFELGRAGEHTDDLAALPLERLAPPARQRPGWTPKRTLDFALTGVGLIMAAPIMLAIAAAILVESGRPVLFRQRRVGANGRVFTCLKFRTMRPADEAREHREADPDPARMTSLGRLLRDTSLDELPQLLNVLCGHMSLIGPRPERTYFVELNRARLSGYDARHRVPGGITGLAQVNGLRGDCSDEAIERRVAADNFYIENWSFEQDLKILAKTFRAVARRDKEGVR